MITEDPNNLEPAVKEIIHDFKGILDWKKDDWIRSSLSEFNTDETDKISEILNKHLPFNWDKTTLGQAPETIQNIASGIGGINEGQLLFASEPSSENFIFGAWWPWGNGQKISIRLAPFSLNFSKEEMDAFIKVFQSWFE